MITKIKRVAYVGKFYDYSAKGDGLDWHKNTFLFAPNAYGKSTLVNVLRSLRDNDPKPIRARRTLGKVAAPDAVILIDGAPYVFNGTRWDRLFPKIQIFDAPYIHANILAHEIEYEHRKNSYKIIIGAKGIILAEELARLKAKEKDKSQEVSNLAARFNSAGLILSLDAFLAVPDAEEAVVGSRIQKLEQDRKSKESEGQVRGLGFPQGISAPTYGVLALKSLVAQKLAAAHEAAEKRVLAHINRNFKNKAQAKEFIRQGLDLVQADCPFCGQDLKSAADLLKAYREFFDDVFRKYQQNLALQAGTLAKWNLDNDLTALVSAHNANIAILKQWEPFIGPETLPDVVGSVDAFRPTLTGLKDKVQGELDKKQKDPNADAALLHFDTFVAELAALKIVVESYNAAVAAFTEKAKQYVANLPKSDVASIRAAIAKEEEIKKRFAPEWKKWTADYPTAKKDAADLLTKKNAKQAELAAYTKTIFETCQTRINELLLSLGADFAVTDLTGKTDERANESYSDFGFLILEKKVPLTAHQDDEPCFKNTLSEGDKSTLAFAFFIAALEKIPELDKQIVIFDDPLSSLDENRRLGTVALLAGLSPRLNQLCVFTHKKDFFRMLFDGIHDKGVLQLKSDKKNGSRIEPFDVEDDRKAEIARLCDDMSRYLNEDFGPTPEDMQGNIRKVFEIILKTKYYRALTAEIKGKSGLGDLIGTLHGKGLVSDATKDQLFRLCRLSDVAHHGGLAKLPEHTLTREEICSAIQETFSVAEKV
jgi:wobble nucleotide-excising tRNase